MARVLLIVIVSLIAPAGVAADLGVAVGGRRYENKRPDGETHRYDANELTAAAHIGVFDWPLAVGVAYSLFDHKEKTWDAVSESARVSGWEIGAEAVVATGNFFGFESYGKVRYTLASGIRVVDRFALTGGTDDVEGRMVLEGCHLAAGLRLPLVLGLSVIAEINQGVQMFWLRKLQSDGSDSGLLADGVRKEDFNSRAALVGMEVDYDLDD